MGMKTVRRLSVIFLIITTLTFVHISLNLNRNFTISDGDEFDGCSRRISSAIKSVFLVKKWKEIRGASCDDRDEYFIIKNVFKTAKMRRMKRNSNTVTIITQTTPNHVAALDVLAQRWKDPISVAIFLCMKDIQTVLKSLIKYRDITASFHFVAIDWNVKKSSVCERMMTSKTGFINPREKKVPFPFNILRNVALSAVSGGYVFMTDIDMVPNANLHGHFLNHVNAISSDRKLNKNASLFISPDVYISKFRTAYVIPSFEAMNSTYHAHNKTELLSFVKQGFVRQYAIASCSFCQENTMYTKWLSNPDKGAYNIARKTKYYEPFYILHRSSYPEFDERFKDRGINRISQVCEAYMSGVNFKVLNGGFLIHRGFRPRRKEEYETNNHLIFQNMKETLRLKYDTTRQCE